MPKTNKAAPELFFEKIKLNGVFACWEWTGGTMTDGYGSFLWNGRATPAHRVSWMLVYGDIPRGKCVCHRCDNRICVNPAHLFLGSKGDNNRDRHAKGRSSGGSMPGETNPQAKLTAEQAADIRSGALTRAAYAEKYGVTYWTVRDIQTGRIWRTQSSNTRARV